MSQLFRAISHRRFSARSTTPMVLTPTPAQSVKISGLACLKPLRAVDNFCCNGASSLGEGPAMGISSKVPNSNASFFSCFDGMTSRQGPSPIEPFHQCQERKHGASVGPPLKDVALCSSFRIPDALISVRCGSVIGGQEPYRTRVCSGIHSGISRLRHRRGRDPETRSASDKAAPADPRARA